MGHKRLLTALLLAASASGCTHSVEIDLAFEAGLPTATFQTGGLFSRPLSDICIWSAEIIDEVTGARIAELRSKRFNYNCAHVSKVSFSHPDSAFLWAKVPGDLISGRHYRLDVIADGTVGRSDPWLAK
jgi:hypothetical protein